MLRVYNNTARYVDQGGNKVGGGPVVTCCRFLAPQITTTTRRLFLWWFATLLDTWHSMCISLCYSLDVTASWGICHLLGALASWCLWLSGSEKEPRLRRKGIHFSSLTAIQAGASLIPIFVFWCGVCWHWYADTECRGRGGSQKLGDVLLCHRVLHYSMNDRP